MHFETKATLLKVLDIFFSTVKPAIPICLYTTLMFSMKRLERAKIHTINKFKINEAGRIDIVCFDKTGTLTEEFPKTFAYGINTIPYNVQFSAPFKDLIFPKVKKTRPKGRRVKKSPSQNLEVASDIIDCKLKEGSRIRETRSSLRKQVQGKNEETLKRMHRRLSNMGNVYNLDPLDRPSNLEVNSRSMFTFKSKVIRENPFKVQEMNMSQGKGAIREFCDNVQHVIEDVKVNRMAQKYLECMSFCHTLINIDDTYIGDPLEVEMVSKSPFACRYVSNINDSSFKKIYYPKSRPPPNPQRKSRASTPRTPSSRCCGSLSFRTSPRRCPSSSRTSAGSASSSARARRS